MVVAHPDDESLFGAGLLLRYPGKWEVICCTTPERDPGRAELFHLACANLGAKSRILPQCETASPLRFDDLNIEDADLIVTHNHDGEYGHKHHKEVHEFVTHAWPGKTLCFGYRPKRSSGGELTIELTPAECAAKMQAIQCYDNIGSSGRPTWTQLIEYFAPRFDLWREPYERFC